MKKIILIIKREYLTRVKKRSFIIMTILGPLLMAGIMIVPIYLATMSDEVKTVSILDETGLFYGKFKDDNNLKFHYLVSDIASAKASFKKSGDYALLYIPKTELTLPTQAIMYGKSQVNLSVRSYVQNVMSKQIERLKLEAKLKDLQPEGEKITTDDVLRSINATVSISTIKLGEEGTEEKGFADVSMVLGMFSGILIYFFIFLFGAQVMRGIIEEKTNRIVEVIISSVKPFQLMMGKIIGVGAVGLTQFLLWVILTGVIVIGVTSSVSSKMNTSQTVQSVMANPGKYQVAPATADSTVQATNQQNENVNEIMERINSVDFPVMILSFLFFFLFGYLMYAALFAAVGSAVDSEADTQQFMLPITVPLILSIVLAQYVINEPQGSLSFWLSIVPLTSPVIMMIRIPFGVPTGEIALSMILLVLGFLGTTWLAARIYRTGILMYGKKVSYREIAKWLKY